MSCHDDGVCTIANRHFENLSLADFIACNPSAVGENFNGKFPLIIKLIDADDNLSVQVHPAGENCKNEMWYVLDCEENSCILYGLKDDTSEQVFRQHIRDNTVTDLMNKVPVHKGDVFYIKAGTLHAIGSGILVAEIQQNSNVTYRVYDYERTDKYGNKRPLHIEEAMKVIDFRHQSEIHHKTYSENNVTVLNECEFFRVYEISAENQYVISNDKSSFSNIIITEGSGTISEYSDVHAESFKKGDSFFLSAGCDYIIKGKTKFILTKV